MKTLIVTGGAGFIGSCLVRRLVVAGEYHVVNLDKLTYAGDLDSLQAVDGATNYSFVEGDIADGPLIAKLLNEYQPVAVINLAAESHVDRSIDDASDFVQTNVVGTFQLLETTRHYWQQLSPVDQAAFRFLQVSTDEVFGSLDATGKFTESSPYAPNSPYSASKASADHFVRAFHETYGLPTLLTNCSNNYGPFQFPEKLIPLMVLNALESKPLPIYGDGQNVRDWLHVDDHCRALEAVLRGGKPGELYLVGGDSERTNLEVVVRICEVVDRLAPNRERGPCAGLTTRVADRPGHDRRYAIDATKIRTDLGWTPDVSFDSGIEQTVQWYIDNRNWVDRVASGEYRQRRGLADRSPQQ